MFVAKSINGRPIAILDSVSGRVVKLYSTVKSASKAVETILKLGHRCEWNASASRTDLNLKLIAEKSRNDPNSLLFGYRWLFLDDLEDGKVTFLTTVCDIIEMQHNLCTFVFRSIEEALSSAHLSKTSNIDELRSKLTNLPRNGNWTEIDELKWRRPMISERRDSSAYSNTEVSDEISVESSSNIATESENLPSWKNCSFLKKDLVTGQNLVGFDSIQLAHEDWMQTALSSPSFPESEPRTMEYFKKYYLDGDRNVDGMIWQTVDGSNGVEQGEGNETTKNENLIEAMKIENPGKSQSMNSDSTEQGNNSMLSKNEDSRSKSSMNESSFSSIAMDSDGQQRIPSSQPSNAITKESSDISRKRKCLNDDKIDFPTAKEARRAIVTVE